MTSKPPFVITISRQLGSGGAYIGQALAKKLAMYYADREIICLAARQLSTHEEVLESREERLQSFWQSLLESFAFTAPEAYMPPHIAPTDRELFHVESEIIKDIADKHSAVIVGRCASQILCDHPHHVRIFLHGDIACRKRRVQDLYEVTEEAAEHMIHKSDHERSRYIYEFTGSNWNDSTQYNLSIDTSKLEIDKCVDLILNYVALGTFYCSKPPE